MCPSVPNYHRVGVALYTGQSAVKVYMQDKHNAEKRLHNVQQISNLTIVQLQLISRQHWLMVKTKDLASPVNNLPVQINKLRNVLTSCNIMWLSSTSNMVQSMPTELLHYTSRACLQSYFTITLEHAYRATSLYL